MTKKQLWINVISFMILPVAIYSVTPYPAPATKYITYIQNTTFWWIIEASVLIIFFLSSRYFFDIRNTKNLRVVQWYLFWVIFSFFHGLFVAQTYWDWKGLVGNTLSMLIPIVAYTGTNKTIMQSMLTFYLKYTLPLFFIFGPIIHTDAYGFFLMPVSFLMLFFPAMPNRWRIILIAFSLLVMLIDFDARSNVIKFTVPFLLLSIYYFRKFIVVKWLEVVRLVLMFGPILLFFLAVTGIFDVFNMDNYVSGKYVQVKRNMEGDVVEYNLKSDTRSFLYQEVLSSAKIFNFWWIGRSPARGNLSEAFGDLDENGRGERLGNEVAVLNVFTWTGVIGVILYLFVFYRASYISINYSNNYFSKMLGVLLAFRWAYSWVEDINNYTLNYFMLWIIIGFCFSKSFRTMTDKEVIHWAQGIFNINYNTLFKKRPKIRNEIRHNQSLFP